jgi:hypothetical protein
MAKCPICSDFERRYEDLLEVHGKVLERLERTEKALADATKLQNPEYKLDMNTWEWLHDPS